MKKIYWRVVLMVLSAIPGVLFAQIPNPDFENWDSVTLNKPSGYRVYGNTFKVSGYGSPFAVRIEKNENMNNGPGAVLYGNPENNFSGGISISGRPDSAVADFKYHIVAGDTAWYLVFLKRNGMFLSQDIFKIIGSDSNAFHRLAFKINYLDTGLADTVVIGIASTNPNDNKSGSFIVVDNLQLTGGPTNIIIPNGDFEQWTSLGFNNLRLWNTTNQRGLGSSIFPVSKTTDHVFGNYACKIQNVSLGGGNFDMGFIMAGRQGKTSPEPGFAVQGRDSILYCHYKCFPQGGDTINIVIMMYKGDTMMGIGSFQQSFTINAWSQVAIPINYWNTTMIPDSAVIFCSAFQGGSNPRGNTILYVDGLSLNKPVSGIATKWIQPLMVYPNPAQDFLNVQFAENLTSDTRVVLIDASGKRILPSFDLVTNGKTLKICTEGLNQGIWFYEINTGTGRRTGRFCVNR